MIIYQRKLKYKSNTKQNMKKLLIALFFCLTALSSGSFAQSLNDYTDQIIRLINDHNRCSDELQDFYLLHDACNNALGLCDSVVEAQTDVITLQVERIDLLSEEVETLEFKVKRRNRWLFFSGVAFVVSIIF